MPINRKMQLDELHKGNKHNTINWNNEMVKYMYQFHYIETKKMYNFYDNKIKTRIEIHKFYQESYIKGFAGEYCC